MILLFLVTTLVLMLIVNWLRLLNERERMNINGPIPLPLLGSAHLFLVKSTEFLQLIQNKIIDKYGDAVMAHIFSQPVVLLNHPKYVEPLITSMDYITKGSLYDFLTCWLGQGLLTSTGQKWKSHRKYLTPAFHFNMLQNFLPVFCKNQRVFVDKMRKLADGRSIDIFPLVALAALDNVTESIMGVCVDAQKHEESEYVKAIEEVTAILSMKMQIPILGADLIFNLLPYKTRQDKALKILHDQTRKVIKARSEELRKSKISNRDIFNGIGIKNQHAFLDLLLLAESDGKKIDSQSVQEEVDTFMFEGHDTVTSGVSFSLFCLSKRRDVQEKIYEELKTIFIDDMSRDPTYHELHQMKYLELVLKESMRLFPSVPFIQRLMVNDCEIGALKLVKNTSVIIDIYHMQRHPELYEDPLEFRPERFEAPLKNPFNWLTFSAGPRNCIGQKFAMMELKVMISEMVKNFVILPSDVEPELCSDLTLRSKNGIHVKLVQRQNSMTNTNKRR